MSDVQAPVLIMAGGTGGHIFPGLAVAAALRARDVPVLWLGAEGGMENRIVPEHRVALRTLHVKGLRGKGLRQRVAAPWMLVRALFGAWRILREANPRSVLSMGGYVAGPGGNAAWLQRRPMLVHEQNRIAGFTNRVLARIARKVMAGFSDAFPVKTHAEWTGNPVRADIAALPAPETRFANRTGAPRLLVLGGSLGARTL
jgi:UDP-N-acetylglucosamine--N-acetylmuramyl-(pentapeptide) pyrophosphoryl-undecaprenol N-acetylglucosamine transferase